MLTRRQFLGGAVGTLGCAAMGFGYAKGVEPAWLAVSRVHVPLTKASGSNTPIRLLHLSDFHLSPQITLEFIARSIELGLSEKPDLVALTGDFFTDMPENVARYAATLSRLSSYAPTFACLGNHDGGPWSRRCGGPATAEATVDLLQRAAIPCLTNEGRTIVVRDRRIQVIGVGDYWSGMCRPQDAYAHIPADEDAVRLLLNHNPDAKTLLQPYPWDVMLCGHTHGGQLRLPWVGTPYAPVQDKRYIRGLYEWDNRWLHITSGVGNLHGVRFNCRPEVSLLTLV